MEQICLRHWCYLKYGYQLVYYFLARKSVSVNDTNHFEELYSSFGKVEEHIQQIREQILKIHV